jgi:hypothetical protein
MGKGRYKTSCEHYARQWMDEWGTASIDKGFLKCIKHGIYYMPWPWGDMIMKQKVFVDEYFN